MIESIDSLPSGREQLLRLENEDRYVFHGSENPDLDQLEPRQGYDYINGAHEPDGDPAVFASNKADYAILMAIVNRQNCPNGYSSSAGTVESEKGEIVLELTVTKDAIEQLTDESSGYVYVFNRNDFEPRENKRMEFVSKIPISSVDRIKVTKKDLPSYIKVLDDVKH